MPIQPAPIDVTQITDEHLAGLARLQFPGAAEEVSKRLTLRNLQQNLADFPGQPDRPFGQLVPPRPTPEALRAGVAPAAPLGPPADVGGITGGRPATPTPIPGAAIPPTPPTVTQPTPGLGDLIPGPPSPVISPTTAPQPPVSAPTTPVAPSPVQPPIPTPAAPPRPTTVPGAPPGAPAPQEQIASQIARQGPIPTTPAEKQELKSKWEQFFTNPAIQVGLLQFALSTAEGESLVRAAGAGLQATGRAQTAIEKKEAARAKGALAARKTEAEIGAAKAKTKGEARRTKIAERRLDLEMDKEKRVAKDEKDKLAIEKMKTDIKKKAEKEKADSARMDAITKAIAEARKGAEVTTVDKNFNEITTVDVKKFREGLMRRGLLDPSLEDITDEQILSIDLNETAKQRAIDMFGLDAYNKRVGEAKAKKPSTP